jgi:hypothetical protein
MRGRVLPEGGTDSRFRFVVCQEHSDVFGLSLLEFKFFERLRLESEIFGLE